MIQIGARSFLGLFKRRNVMVIIALQFFYVIFVQKHAVYYHAASVTSKYGMFDSIPSTLALDSHNRAQCRLHPPSLRGPFPVDTINPLPIDTLEKQLSSVQEGGRWKPKTCAARERLAVIIPYRDRWQHLRILLRYLHPMLQRQRKDYQIFVVEQAYDDVYNKGLLMNIGFTEAMKISQWDCVIFHDVDMIPENDYNLYQCTAQPQHLSPAVDEMRYTLMYGKLVGGALALRRDHVIKVNGFSNRYWGWGAEDDDMSQRIFGSGYKIMRPPSHIGKYKMIKHSKREKATNRLQLLLDWKRYTHDGINSLKNIKYKVLSVSSHKLYTNITVDVGPRPTMPPKDTKQPVFHKYWKDFLDGLIWRRFAELP